MKSATFKTKDPDIRGSLPALRRAARAALELGMRTSTPVWVIKDGKIVDLTNKHPNSEPRGNHT